MHIQLNSSNPFSTENTSIHWQYNYVDVHFVPMYQVGFYTFLGHMYIIGWQY